MNRNGTPNNLRPPWRKGDPSPNPSGKPRRLPISDTYALFASEPIPESIRRAMKRKGIPIEPGATFSQALCLQILMKAMGGDSKAAKEIRESIEGRAGQRPVDPGDNSPMTIRVVVDDAEKKPFVPKPDSRPDLVPDPDEGTK
jgi:Family of unknown function (DUF5681)